MRAYNFSLSDNHFVLRSLTERKDKKRNLGRFYVVTHTTLSGE